MALRHVRHVALVVRDAEHLQVRGAQCPRTLDQPRAPRLARGGCIALVALFHHSAARGSARYCVSTAVGCDCLIAAMQILIAYTHIASTSKTNTPQTTASR